MRTPSNLPPGVTDRMIEEFANPTVYQLAREAFGKLWGGEGIDARELAWAFAQCAADIVRIENPSDLVEFHKMFDLNEQEETPIPNFSTKWKVISPGIIELPNTKMQIRYESGGKHPYFNVLYNGLPIPSNQHGRLDNAQDAAEAHMAELIAMGFES